MDNRCSVPSTNKTKTANYKVVSYWFSSNEPDWWLFKCSILSQKAMSDDLVKCILSVCLDRPRPQAQVSLSMLVFPKGQIL